MSDITQKILIDIETKRANDEMRKLARMSNDTGEAMLRMEGRAKELQQSIDNIKKSAGGLTNAFDTFKNGMKSIGNVMSPLNQGLELAGKVVRFAEAGLEAYGKTSTAAAKEVQKLTKEFSDLKNGILSVVGAMTVAAAKGFDVNKMINGVDSAVGRDAFLGGIEKGRNFGSYLRGDDEAADKWAGGKSLFNPLAAERAANDTLRRFGLDDETAAKRKKATEEYARWQAEFAALKAKEQRNYGDAIAKPGNGFQIDTSLLAQRDMINVAGDSFGESSSRGSRYAESAGRRNDTYLASFFGPIEEFNAYATAFGTLTSATQSAMAAWVSGSESLGGAIKKGLGQALAGLASSMAVEALKHGAYAIGSLAFGDVRGAGQHGAAAAAFGAGAVAAAAAAKQLGGGGSAPGAGVGGGAGGGRANGGSVTGGGTSERATGGRSSTIVVYADPFAEGTPGTRRRSAQKVLARAKGGNDWEDS